MRKVTQQITDAFLNGRAKKVGNTQTDGKHLYLFGNKIAEHREDGLYITNAGWQSRTTRDRLEALPNVNIFQKKFVWHLNGNAWDGSWIKVNDNPPPIFDSEHIGEAFDLSMEWVKTDAWRGYEKPKYSVAWASDTGMWDDSPCKSDVAERELNAIRKELADNKIPNMLKTCPTSNVFCVHHYIVVPPRYYDKAREVVTAYLFEEETNLLYSS